MREEEPSPPLQLAPEVPSTPRGVMTWSAADRVALPPQYPEHSERMGLWHEGNKQAVLSNSTRDVDGHKVGLCGAGLKPALLL